MNEKSYFRHFEIENKSGSNSKKKKKMKIEEILNMNSDSELFFY